MAKRNQTPAFKLAGNGMSLCLLGLTWSILESLHVYFYKDKTIPSSYNNSWLCIKVTAEHECHVTAVIHVCVLKISGYRWVTDGTISPPPPPLQSLCLIVHLAVNGQFFVFSQGLACCVFDWRCVGISCTRTLWVDSDLQDGSQRTSGPPHIERCRRAAGSGPDTQTFNV